MWDFSIGRTLAIMARTWPFIVLRLIVYFCITIAYVLATGAGAGLGWGVGHIFADGGPEGTAFWGAVTGFGLVAGVLDLLREYILYVVKAGHIAVMVHLIDGRDVPGGQGQIAYARQIVTQRFADGAGPRRFVHRRRRRRPDFGFEQGFRCRTHAAFLTPPC